MLQKIRQFLRDEEGPTAVEYAIMVAGIGLAILAGVYLLGGKVGEAFNKVAGHVPGGSGSGTTP